MHTSGNSSIDTSLIRGIYCGPEVLFETCVAIKFVDDDDDDVVGKGKWQKKNVECVECDYTRITSKLFPMLSQIATGVGPLYISQSGREAVPRTI